MKLWPKVIVGTFFASVLALGLLVWPDYNVHCDGPNNEAFGRRMNNYVTSVLRTGQIHAYPVKDEHDLLHGPVFEMFLSALPVIFGLKDTRDIFLTRHLSTFLLFYFGVIFFYLLCQKHFQSWRLALLGCVFLVLSPRIFADAFYNSVDITFLVFFIISIFTLLCSLDRKTFRAVAFHALACSILIDIRLLGLLLPAVTIVAFLWEIARSKSSQDRGRSLKTLAVFLSILIPLTVLFNPFLWSSPWGNLLKLFQAAHSFKWWGSLQYLGKSIPYANVPWHFALVWIAVTTPLMYTALTLFGLAASGKALLQRTSLKDLESRNVLIFLLWFLIPLALAPGKIYTGWRHIYFLYPAMIILALAGVRYVWSHSRPIIKGLFVLGICFCLLDVACFMIRNHPFQNMYFNVLAGRNPDEIKQNFDLDYWGFSYGKGLEYILKTDQDPLIPVCFPNQTGERGRNIQMLPPKDRKRLIYKRAKDAKYFLTPVVLKPFEYPGTEYYAVKVDGVKILVIYKLSHEKP